MASLISAKTGINAEQNNADKTIVELKPSASSSTAGKGMTLQDWCKRRSDNELFY